MRRHARKYIWTAAAAILLGIMVALAQSMCERAWGQDQSTPQTITVNEQPNLHVAKIEVLSEVEKLKLVNTYQAAVLAQVDKNNAEARATRTRDAYLKLADAIRAEHRWTADTNFEINSETGEVTVHLPAPKPVSKPESNSTNPPPEGTKEQH